MIKFFLVGFCCFAYPRKMEWDDNTFILVFISFMDPMQFYGSVLVIESREQRPLEWNLIY